ncbi:hypothetical protein ACLE2W_11845 [Pseudomonas shahriarae]|uniref:hypothetical protein n=1 Tax=Pseudomonas shahriarae TaxID=2745512 RepID=UPI002076BAD9|nr:hypothetical protein [Pseudomonas shahriarae]MCM8560810.1 hypothetical protein [Pseudomonas shahriarae]
MLELWQAHLTLVLLGFVVTPRFGLRPGMQVMWLIVLLGVSFISINGLSLAAYFRSFTDDVAITSLVALGFAAAVRMGLATRQDSTARLQLLIPLAALALFLYPATMGMTYFDPYRLGYNPRPLIMIIGAMTLGLMVWRNWLGVCMFGLATLAFSLGVKPSPNYWDYLLDPFIALYCWGALIVYAINMIWRGLSARRKFTLPIRV